MKILLNRPEMKSIIVAYCKQNTEKSMDAAFLGFNKLL